MAERAYFPANAVRICIDERGEGRLAGRVYGTMLADALVFRDFGELMLGIDAAFDKQGLPQAFQTKRTFKEGGERSAFSYNSAPDILCAPQQVLAMRGEIDTLDVWVTSRQNTSWQGRVTTAAGEVIGNFASDLALLRLLDGSPCDPQA